MKSIVSSIEPLEARIAPAAVVVPYTDVDGDLVKITDSSGHLTAADLTFVGGGTSGQLAELNLTASMFAGASITFSVVYKAGGDGLANVGFIDAGTNKLGAVSVKGDLGRIDAGSGSGTAIQSLTVNSMGRLGTDTQLGGGSLESAISGSLGSLTVAHDLVGALIFVSDGGIGPVTIGGSLLGGSANDSGAINSAGNIGPVKIGQDVQGGGGTSSGSITATDNLTSVAIGGSLIGGAGFGSGLISTEDGTMGAVKIGHDVQGGGNSQSGSIFSNGKLASVSIGGSLFGGSGPSSGQIDSNAGIGPVKIAHYLQGRLRQRFRLDRDRRRRAHQHQHRRFAQWWVRQWERRDSRLNLHRSRFHRREFHRRQHQRNHGRSRFVRPHRMRGREYHERRHRRLDRFRNR